MSEKTIWFKRKKYGWGWTPCTWQGWIITLMYALLIVLPEICINQWSQFKLNIFYGYLISITAIFFYILIRTGESPRWSWGDDGEKK